jgi:alpha-galactosidase
MQGRWAGRFWGAGGRSAPAGALWTSDAFEIRIKTEPTPDNVPGTLVETGWRFETSFEPPSSEQHKFHFVVNLSNSIHPLKLAVHTVLDGTPVLTRWLEITNTSSKPLAITGLAPWSGRLWNADAPVRLGHALRWDHQWNGWYGWTPLEAGANVIEESHGLAYDDPYFVLQNSARGEYFFGQLAWPVNYRMEFQKADGLTFKIGPTSTHVLRVLEPAETIATPAVHLAYVKGDFDATVQAMHQHIRRSVLPARDPKRAHLVQYLLPEDQPLTIYRGKDYNEATVKKCMDVAAAAGVEVFIVDGPTWCKTYGEWLQPDLERFPNGLAPLREYARQKGLLFGLYAEPEGGRKGYCSGPDGKGPCIANWDQSQVGKDHPDWFVQPNFQLNLAIPEAAAYFKTTVREIVEHYELDLYRHDYNTPAQGDGSRTMRHGFAECNYWRHYDAFYDAFQNIRNTHPDVILQQASGGGTRLELKTCGVFDEQYSSDRANSPWVYQMSAGLAVTLPPEILVTPNGMADQHQPDFITVLRAAYFLGNTPMLFNAMLPRSLEEFTPQLQKQFQHYTEIYKSFIRPMLPDCKVWLHAPVNAEGGIKSGDWFAMEFTSPDRTKGWATVIHLSQASPLEYSLKPKGLDPDKAYKVTFDNTGASSQLRGSHLAKEGVPIRLGEGRSSEVILIEAAA